MPDHGMLTLDSPHTHHAVRSGLAHVFIDEPSIAENVCRTDCLEASVGDAHEYADVLVALCGASSKCPHKHRDKAQQQQPPQQLRADTIAMCIPPLYGEYLRKTEALDAHLSYHRSLGVAWTFVYTTVPLVDWRRPANTTLLHLPWVWSVAIHQRAQNWMINDCIQRSSSHGYTWALNIDLDEYVVLPRETPTLLALANTAGVGIDVLTFGSRPGSSIEDAATRKPHCNVAKSREQCLWYHGLRKHLTRTDFIWRAVVHGVGDTCCHGLDANNKVVGRTCNITNLDASRTYLAHLAEDHSYRGMPGRAPLLDRVRSWR